MAFVTNIKETNWNIRNYQMLGADKEKSHKICSVFDFEFNFNNQHGQYTLPACGPNQEYTFVEVHPSLDKIEHGDFKVDHVWCYTAKSMARDCIGWQRNDSDNLETQIPSGEKFRMYQMRGLFVPEGDVPTEQELSAARQERDAFYARAVDAGDSNYAERGHVKDVDDNAKRGAKVLQLDRPWNKTQDRKLYVDCPACGKPALKGVIKHDVCGAILDRKRAAEYGFIPPEVAVPVTSKDKGAK